MSDAIVAHTGENPPEQAAYKLMETIANVERIALQGNDLQEGWTRADLCWIFTTYRECLYAVSHHKVPERSGAASR
jgi:hypothetical protein